jgi:hypothetical protein
MNDNLQVKERKLAGSTSVFINKAAGKVATEDSPEIVFRNLDSFFVSHFSQLSYGGPRCATCNLPGQGLSQARSCLEAAWAGHR